MRKLSFTVALVILLALSACKCSAEKGAVANVQKTHDLISVKFLKYVNADEGIAGPKVADESDASYLARKVAARDDWKKLVESDKRNIDALKKSLGD